MQLLLCQENEKWRFGFYRNNLYREDIKADEFNKTNILQYRIFDHNFIDLLQIKQSIVY